MLHKHGCFYKVYQWRFRLASSKIDAINCRYFIHFIFFIPLDGGFKNLLTQQLNLHLLPGFLLVIANLFFFTALVVMPLGETTSISFIAPL